MEKARYITKISAADARRRNKLEVCLTLYTAKERGKKGSTCRVMYDDAKSETLYRCRSYAGMTAGKGSKVREVRARRLNGIALVHTRL